MTDFRALVFRASGLSVAWPFSGHPLFQNVARSVSGIAAAPAANLTELLDPFCQGDHTSCRLFTDEGLLITIDGGHLSEAGAKFLTQVLKRLIEAGE
ncbi:hypothetical protein [Paenirhodobacter populi]|uniref:SGNH domain-containing protein n=1 Tax=Paenirhodobacter populi TaxID=2306993 RepID=A0A443IPA8_9RHOB|nr:hypothetical protein [Sinirhodobacter populi]RWR08129.1 hypothetical protein D2T33_16010 [Sinirhodobacter populi]